MESLNTKFGCSRKEETAVASQSTFQAEHDGGEERLT
jgi:hypothetical protein